MKIRWLFILAFMSLYGCAINSVPVTVPVTVVGVSELKKKQQQSGGLNVAIRVFDAGDMPESSIYVAASQVREVERRYLPYLLKQTLDRSGYWGAVRVLPRSDPSAEINVSARILESNGRSLGLQVIATSATGEVWLDKTYLDENGAADYETDPNYVEDAFQDIYSRIANDMAFKLENQDSNERQLILDTALMRYGELLSPAVFSRYLQVTETGYSINGLPARDDPMLSNLLRLREAEYLFADSVDAQYEELYRTVGPTYAWWRYYSFELLVGNERLAKIDATRGATKGSWYAMERVYKTFKEAKMNQDALRELSESFGRETSATRAEISGRVFELSGSLDQQYVAWRRILRSMYEEATSLEQQIMENPFIEILDSGH